jgi:hypothetical protein
MALHGGAAVLVSRWLRRPHRVGPAPTAPQPLWLSIAPPQQPPAKPRPSAAAATPLRRRPPARQPRDRSAGGERAGVQLEAPDSPPPPRDTGGPRRVDLFGGVSALSAPPGPMTPAASVSAATLGEARIRAWAREAREAAQAGAGMPEEVRKLGELLQDAFVPEAAPLARASKLGLGALSTALAYGQAGEGLGTYATDFQQQRGASPIESVGPGPGGLRPIPVLCIGACSGFKHDVASLAVVVEVEHDPHGVPQAWRVQRSSGDAAFDADGLAAVRHAVRGWRPPDAPARRVVRTVWELRAQALRFTRAELLLDPGFTPPGTIVEEESGLLGETRLIRAATLLTLRYAP